MKTSECHVHVQRLGKINLFQGPKKTEVVYSGGIRYIILEEKEVN